MLKAVILNDTTRDLGHIGCCMVINNICSICKKNNVDVIYKDRICYNNIDEDEFLSNIKKVDVVLLNGEGTLHDNVGDVWFKKALIAKNLGKKVFLINSVWQNNNVSKKYLDVFDAISVRESFSYEDIIKDRSSDVFCVPDMSFYSFPFLEKKSGNNYNKTIFIDSTIKNITTLLIMYSYKKQTDMLFMYEKNKNRFKRYWKNRLLNFYYGKNFEILDSYEKILWSDKVVSGRYHADCLAMMIGVPALGIISNTWKVDGLFHDADLEEYVLKDIDILEQRINAFMQTKPVLWKDKSQEYSFIAEKKIKEFFKLIL